MAAEAITAANVVPSVLAKYVELSTGLRTVGAVAFAAGTLAYKLANDTFGIATATGSDPIHKPVGMFVNSGGAGQPCDIVWYDPALAVSSSTFDVGTVYILGLAGALNPASDATTGWQVSPVATGLTATTICLFCPMGMNVSNGPLTVPTPAHA